MQDNSKIRLAKDREFREILISQIVVVNSRSRGSPQFKENVRSIRDVGLYKPIIVNKRNYKNSRKYELVCGEGRMLAHMELGKKKIYAEVIDVDDETHQLMTLGENIARNPPQIIEFAYAIKEMNDRGMSLKELEPITGRSESWLSRHIILVEKGEERLIRGVEQGTIPIEFAFKIAEANGSGMQNLLIEAFDQQVVTTRNIDSVKRIIEERKQHGPKLRRSVKNHREVDMTVKELKREISRVTKQREHFCRESNHKETRLYQILGALKELNEDPGFMELLEDEAVEPMPQLRGNYVA